MTLSFNPDTVELPNGHFIGGRYVPAAGRLAMHRPSDGAAFAECPIASEDIVDQAVASARQALKKSGWSGLRPRERTRALSRWADLIEAEAVTLARLEAVASTRPIGPPH
ncbi:acyl-CoA reductase-like NAD-dependent aldehyde dehydrogenase [Sinorhizobium fredii]